MTSIAAADDRLELLRSVTNVDRPTAERLLQRAKGDVAAAANLFFESGAILEAPPPPPQAAAPPVAAASSDEAWPRLLGDLVVRAYTTVKLAAAEPLLEGDAVELDASASGAGVPAAGSKRKAADELPPLRFRRPGGGAELGRLPRDAARYLRPLLRDGSRDRRVARARSPASI